MAVALLSAACATADTSRTSGPPRSSDTPTAMEQLGITVEAVRLSAAGLMLDFRFRVVDPEKARLIMDRAVKPYLIEESSGAKFLIPSSPKLGPMRQTTPRAERGRVFWLLFGNPSRYVKRGDLVTVVVGDIRLEHIPVQ